MKNTTFDPRIEQDDVLAKKVSQATLVLNSVLGSSAALVDASWSTARDDKGKEFILLKIADWTASAQQRFAPDELDCSRQLRDKMHWLWGDLLQERSRKQSEALHETVQQLVGH